MAVEVVVGSPTSDIGKGWLTSSIGVHLQNAGENPLVFKIDPALVESSPPIAGVLTDGEYLTGDSRTYRRRGLGFNARQNIFLGRYLNEGIGSIPNSAGTLARDKAPIPQLADISARIASHIDTTMQEAGTSTAVIEVGGCPDDGLAVFIPGAMRWLDHKYGVGINVLTKYDSSHEDDADWLKTRTATRAIEIARSTYGGLRVNNVFVRRAEVPDTIGDDQLIEATAKIAFTTQLRPESVLYVPNVKHPEDLDKFTYPVLRRYQTNATLL